MISIRQITAADLDALSVLAKTTYVVSFGHTFSPEDLEKRLEETRSVAALAKDLEEDIILGAFSGETLIGFIQIGNVTLPVEQPTPDDQELKRLYIHADFQGRGIGRKLMDAAFALPRFSNAARVYTDVWDQNKRAYGLYKSYGFTEAGKCDVTAGGRVVGYDLVLVRSRR